MDGRPEVPNVCAVEGLNDGVAVDGEIVGAAEIDEIVADNWDN